MGESEGWGFSCRWRSLNLLEGGNPWKLFSITGAKTSLAEVERSLGKKRQINEMNMDRRGKKKKPGKGKMVAKEPGKKGMGR